MDFSISSFREHLLATITFLNQPTIREPIKKVIGVAGAIFGVLEAYDLYMIFRGKRPISDEVTEGSPKWMQVGHKFAVLSLKLSILFNGLASRPFGYVAAKTARLILTDARMLALFGSINPKHVISMTATVCGIPPMIQSAYRIGRWVNSQYQGIPLTPPTLIPTKRWMSDKRARMIAHINVAIGKPAWYIVNQILQRI
jgi:hypothetical protein